MARRIKPDEVELWDRVAADIKPLHPNKRNRLIELGEASPESTNKIPTKRKTNQAKPIKINEAPLAPDPRPHAGVDKRTFERLKRGKMSIEARLDLHGHTQEAAHRALDAFIEAAYDAGRRCVLVITGKGLRGEEGHRGVLREKVPQWLSSGRLNPMIVSWQPAQLRDGGEGALYILIRRRR